MICTISRESFVFDIFSFFKFLVLLLFITDALKLMINVLN